MPRPKGFEPPTFRSGTSDSGRRTRRGAAWSRHWRVALRAWSPTKKILERYGGRAVSVALPAIARSELFALEVQATRLKAWDESCDARR